EDIFDCYGVDIEFHSNDCHILRPSEHLRLAHFPGLPDDGITLTTSRVIGLAREDLQFVTWEHPMVTASMDMVLSSETGNAAVSVVKLDQVKAGRFFLECLFVVECSAPESLQVRRFLPSAPIRVLIDQNKKDVTNSILHEQIVDSGVKFDKRQIVAFLNNQRLPITHLLNLAEQKATLEMNAMIERATLLMLTTLTSEIKRLVRLRKVNPSIREEEIEQLKDFTELLHEHIQEAKIKLDAVRFVITS
ncbi:MAG: RNA polymerase-associated protein RapA, partial [Methylicorpusculum sp.]|nr:RNA polymerase-associated protein RapA [Methylicorpusculum sp.]